MVQYPAMRTLTAIVAIFAFLSPASALEIDHDDDAQALAAALVGGGSAGVTITSAKVSGHDYQTGFYTDGPLGLADGIILSSGKVWKALPPNSAKNTSGDMGGKGHALCSAMSGYNKTYDAVVLELTFDLAPGYDGVNFQYVSGSEEFPEYVDTEYNDVVAVIVDGENVAVDGQGLPITINGSFYKSDSVITDNGTEMDGATPQLTSRAPLQGGTTGHTLIAVVCDVSDRLYDTVLFMSGLTGCNGDCTGTSWCGDGGVDAGEGCDDGNNDNGDGCSNSCQVEDGFICAGAPSVCSASCGNGIQDSGLEQCDDGNDVDDDACSNACILATCSDGQQNGAEGGVDCGGTCPGCPDGSGCTEGDDCASAMCFAGTCLPPTCDDRVTNGQETDEDCGGPECDACDDGLMCLVGSDCKERPMHRRVLRAPELRRWQSQRRRDRRRLRRTRLRRLR